MAVGRNIKGITIELDGDTTKLTKALKESEGQIRNAANGLKDIDKLLKLDPGNTDLLTQKYKGLQTEIGGAKDKLKLLKEAQEQMQREGKVGTEEYEALQREIVETEQKVKSLTNEMREFGSVSAQKIAAAGEKMKDVGNKISGVGDSMTRNVTMPIAGASVAIFKVAGDFEEQMAKVSGIAQAYGEDLDRLKQNAMDLSEGTRFSATEIAQAYEYMGMAGWNTNQILAGTPGILNLATASGEDLAAVSDIVTDGLTAFGLKAEDTTRFVNVLAEASRSSNTNVELMGESFKYVGPVAGAMGYQIEDVAVALGLMANSGIKGSMAGTSLRNMLQRMAKPTKESQMAMDRLGLSMTDSSGNMLSLKEIMEQLRGSMNHINMPLTEYNARLDELDAALEDGTIKQKDYDKELEELNLQAFGAEGAEKARAAAMLGGTRAMAALMAVSSATEEDYNNLTAAVQHSGDTMVRTADGAVKPLTQALADGDEIVEQLDGTAAAMAGTMNDTANVQMKQLTNQLQVLAIELGNTLLPIVKDVVEIIKEWTKKFSELSPETQEFIVKAALIVAALGPVLSVFGRLISAFGTIMTWVPKIVGGFSSLGSGISGAFSAISGAASTAWTAISSAFSSLGSVLASAASSIGTFFTADLGATMAAGGTAAVGTACAAIASSVVAFFGGAEIGKKIGSYLFPDDADLYEHYSGITGTLNLLKDTAVTIGEEISYGLQDAWGAAKAAGQEFAEGTSEHFNNFKTNVTTALDNVKEAGRTFAEQTSEHYNNFKTNVTTALDNVKEAAGTFTERTAEHWNNAGTKLEEFGNKAKAKFDEFKASIQSGLDKAREVGDGIKQKFEDLRNSVNGHIDNLKEKIDTLKQKFTDIKDHIMRVVDWLKNCFNFEWKLPDIKLPHFSIDGSLSLDPPSVPKLKVDWYAKAMEKGMILNSPTIFGAAGGKLLGGGEAGSEAVVGTASLQNMIASAVAAAGPVGDIVIPVNIGSKRIETIVVEAQQLANYKSGGR